MIFIIVFVPAHVSVPISITPQLIFIPIRFQAGTNNRLWGRAGVIHG